MAEHSSEKESGGTPGLKRVPQRNDICPERNQSEAYRLLRNQFDPRHDHNKTLLARGKSRLGTPIRFDISSGFVPGRNHYGRALAIVLLRQCV